MPWQYKPTKHAFYTEGDSLTETEHQESTDINKIMKDILNGKQVRTGPEPVFGEDDLNLTAVQHRINKQKIEDELQQIAAEHEFSEEELKHVPKKVQEKIKFKTKKRRSNDDHTQRNSQNQNGPGQTHENNTRPEPHTSGNSGSHQSGSPKQ